MNVFANPRCDVFAGECFLSLSLLLDDYQFTTWREVNYILKKQICTTYILKSAFSHQKDKIKLLFRSRKNTI